MVFVYAFAIIGLTVTVGVLALLGYLLSHTED